MDKFILKKIIAILISGGIFVAILIAIMILNKTDQIAVAPPNTKDILPEDKKASKVEVMVNIPNTETINSIYN